MKNKAAKPVKPAAKSPDLIEQIEERIEANLDPKLKEPFDKIVIAGMGAALEGGPKGLMGSLVHSPDPVRDCAWGAVSLVLIMRKQAKGVMPMKAMIPAGQVLMLKGLDTLARAKIVTADAQTIEKATMLYANRMFKCLGITKEMISGAMTKLHGLIQDPVAVERMKWAGGAVRDPRAATPVPLQMQTEGADGRPH